MKKIMYLSLALLISCAHITVSANELADEAANPATSAQEDNANAISEEQDEQEEQVIVIPAHMVAKQLFVNLIKEAQEGKATRDEVVFFALYWGQQLANSEDPEDQAFAEQLFGVVENLTKQLNEIADSAEKDTQEDNA